MILLEYGKKVFFDCIFDFYWFQVFGVVLGMDWYLLGIIISVMGVLKCFVNYWSYELGIYIVGGKGKYFC